MKVLTQSRPDKGWMLAGACLMLTATFSAIPVWAQDAARKTIGITPLVSNVASIQADDATDLFINALMETSRFTIKPPDANGAFIGVDYVLETTISEGKTLGEGKIGNNALNFFKDAVTSNVPIKLTIRIFDPRSNALVNSVTVKSSDTKSDKVNLGDVQSLMGAFGASNDKDASSGSAALEARVGDLIQQAVNRLVNQLGGSAGGGGRSMTQRTPLTR